MFLKKITVSRLDPFNRQHGILKNKTRWFSTSKPLSPVLKLDLPLQLSSIPSFVVSMLDANYDPLHKKHSLGSRTFIKEVHTLLKSKPVVDAEEVEQMLFDLLQRFIGDNPKLFEDIDMIAVMPSSKGKGATLMFKIAQLVSAELRKRGVQDILIRTAPMQQKMSSISPELRQEPGTGAALQFPTLAVNQVFQKDLQNSSVMVLDDDLVFGNTAEAARNLLIAAGVRKFSHLTVCTFGPQYLAQNIRITNPEAIFTQVQATDWCLAESEWLDKPVNDDAVSALVDLIELYPRYAFLTTKFV